MENNITPEEKFNQKMWWLLQQIKEADFLRSPEEPFEFLLREQKDTPSRDDQRKLVYKLEGLKAIKVNKRFTCAEAGLTKVILKESAPESEANGFHLKILPKFNEVYKEFKKKVEKLQPRESSATKTSLKSQEIKFDDDKSLIQVGKQNIPIPPYKNEHYFCRAIFEHAINEPVDWSIIYEKMTGFHEAYYGKPQKTEENWRIVYDTMRAINQRVKDVLNTNDDLFTWQEKTIKRNY